MPESVLFRTRPTTVEARQLTHENAVQVARWVGGWTTFAREHTDRGIRWFGRDGKPVIATVGDWVVKTAFGHYERVSDSVLYAQYERLGVEK